MASASRQRCSRIQGAASSVSRPPGLRPDAIPAGRKCGCGSRPRSGGHPRPTGTRHSGGPEPRVDARRNDKGGGLAECWEVPCRRGAARSRSARPTVVRKPVRFGGGPRHVQHEPEPSQGDAAAGGSSGSPDREPTPAPIILTTIGVSWTRMSSPSPRWCGGWSCCAASSWSSSGSLRWCRRASPCSPWCGSSASTPSSTGSPPS